MRLLRDREEINRLAYLKIAQAESRRDRQVKDALRVGHRHLFDVDAAGAGDHDNRAFARAVDHDPGVDFALDVHPLLHQHLFDRDPLDAHPEDGARGGGHFLLVARQLHPAGLAAPADVDLRLDHHREMVQLHRPRDGFFRGLRDRAIGQRRAMTAQNKFRLILMNFH